ncbi:unnamed protein product, partial [Ectocarpus sp. 8 AP-2014]
GQTRLRSPACPRSLSGGQRRGPCDRARFQPESWRRAADVVGCWGSLFLFQQHFYPNPASRLTAAWRRVGEKGRAIYIYIYAERCSGGEWLPPTIGHRARKGKSQMRRPRGEG